MIAVSDAVLILVSATALTVGLYRWDNNMEIAQNAYSQPATTTQAANANPAASPVTDAIQAGSSIVANTASSNEASAITVRQNVNASSGNTDNRVVDVQSVQINSINVDDDGETTASNAAVIDSRALGIYTVIPGDSLSQIAERYGTTVRSLQEINEIDGSLIKVGQELRYPLPAN